MRLKDSFVCQNWGREREARKMAEKEVNVSE